MQRGDYKDRIQERAEEIAYGEHDEWFYDLPEQLRDEIYTRAMNEVYERCC
jgi:hypothetical protein